jgi:hypothetical protein
MNKQVVTGIAGGVGMSVIALAGALAYVLCLPAVFVDMTVSQPAKVLDPRPPQQITEEAIVSPGFTLPTVTIIGDARPTARPASSKGRGAAEMQRTDESSRGPGVTAGAP